MLYIRKLTTLKIPSCFALQMGTTDASLRRGGPHPPRGSSAGLGWVAQTLLPFPERAAAVELGTLVFLVQGPVGG